MKLSRSAVAPLLLLAACGEPGDRIVVVGYDSASQSYDLEPRQFHTLRDVRALDGEVTAIRGGAELVIDSYASLAPTLEEQLDRAIRDSGNAVKFSAVEKDGAWVPTDYHSLGMATVYWNLESAAALFESWGVDFDELGTIPTYYFIRFEVDVPGMHGVATDNAAYSPLPGLDGFLVLQQRVLDDLPLGMNLGVMVHEYSHAVQARFRFGTPPRVDLNAILSESCVPDMFQEGNADYFGALATGDSNFIRWSVPGTLVDRDLAASRELTEQDVEESLATPCGDETDPHLVGAVWAALLWAIGEEIGHDTLAPALIEALREIARIPTPTLATLPDRLSGKLSPVDRPAACALIGVRFAPVAADVAACP